MGTAEMKDAFNSIDPALQADRVLVWIERDKDGKEWQKVQFSGKRQGYPFSAQTALHDPSSDVILLSRAIAQQLSTGGDIERTSDGDGQPGGGSSA